MANTAVAFSRVEKWLDRTATGRLIRTDFVSFLVCACTQVCWGEVHAAKGQLYVSSLATPQSSFRTGPLIDLEFPSYARQTGQQVLRDLLIPSLPVLGFQACASKASMYGRVLGRLWRQVCSWLPSSRPPLRLTWGCRGISLFYRGQAPRLQIVKK